MSKDPDFQNRTVVSVSNPKWDNAEHTMLTADVLFQELEALGPIPFTSTDNADTAHGVVVWQKAIAGEYGPIADYVPPTPEQLRAAMLPLERWRLNTIIDLQAGLRDRINAAIEDMPEPGRTIARNKLADVQQYYRTDPLFDLLGGHPGIDLSPEDIDAMWADGLALS